jgi:hypothetical protein
MSAILCISYKVCIHQTLRSMVCIPWIIDVDSVSASTGTRTVVSLVGRGVRQVQTFGIRRQCKKKLISQS